MKRIKFLGHHGDVGLWEIDELPIGIKELKTKTIMKGEVTGHHHSFTDGKVKVFGNTQPEYILIEQDAILSHQEHKPILIRKGKLIQIVKEREAVPFQNEIRKVMD